MKHYLESELYSLISNDKSIFQFLQSDSLDGISYWDLEKPEHEWMNKNFWELLGHNPSEKKHLASEWQDIINQDDLNLAFENFNKHCENPDYEYNQVVRYKHKNGSTVRVRRRGVAIRDKNGKPIRMLGAHNDLTQLKLSEEKLLNTNNFLNLILDTSPHMIFVKDNEFKIVQANKAFLDMYPKDQQDKIIGYTTVEKYNKKESDEFLRYDRIAFEEGVSRTFEEVNFPNGNRIISDTTKVRFEDNNNYEYILGIATNVTKQQELVSELKEKNSALKRAQDDIENLINASEVATIIINDLLEIKRFTPSAKNLFKLTNKHINKSILEVVDILNIESIKDIFHKAVDAQLSFEKEILLQNGKFYHIKINPYLTNNKDISGIVLTAIDIDKIKKSEKVIKESQALAELAAKHSNVGIWSWHIDDDHMEWSDGMYNLFSLNKAEFNTLYASFINTVLPEDRDKINLEIENTIAQNMPYNCEYRIYGPNNSIRHIHAIGQYAKGVNGESDMLTGMCFNITALKEAETKLSKLALYDNVTEIPNRVNFLEVLPKAISRAKRQKSIFAVFFLDLDNFKQVNDTLGHKGGDIILKDIVIRIKSTLRVEDFLARIGGDEFAVILENVKNIEEVRCIAQRCLDSVTKEFNILGKSISQSFSLGISIYPDSATTSDQLLQYADTAMYRAKEKGKNNFVFFRDELDQKMQRQNKIEIALRHAVEKNEFSLLYQPQFNHNKEVVGIEALIRWNNSDFKNIVPDEFIPISEKIRNIVEIGDWVLSKAIQDWIILSNQIKPKIIQLCVNISSIQLFESNFIDQTISILSKYGFNPKNLTLEITETHLMNDVKSAKCKLLKISEYGIKIALDDFGKGYSSLNYLANLPITYLKIDKDFIINLNSSNNDLIIKSIIALANNLNMECIAEGVETEDQLNFLKSIHCHKYQGFYFSKPVGIENIFLMV